MATRSGHHDFPKVTCDEITDASRKIPSGKAPGPDGIPDMIIKTVSVKKPIVLRDTFNTCLKFGLFSHSWKVAKLVLLRKGEKPVENPLSYRPICLLNTAGKLFERIIKRRLEKHLKENGDLNEKQFGFRRELSTVDAIRKGKVMEVVDAAGSGQLYRRELCAVVALDVANAFNSAKWSKIEESLRDKGMPQYLSE